MQLTKWHNNIRIKKKNTSYSRLLLILNEDQIFLSYLLF